MNDARILWGLMIGFAVYLFWEQHQRQQQSGAQAAGIPCDSGYLPGKNDTGNWTCVPVG